MDWTITVKFLEKKADKKINSYTPMTTNSCSLNLIYWEGVHLEVQYFYTAASDALTTIPEFD